jgi:hypothetical protein
VSISYASPRLQRSLAVVYRFYDAFLFPLSDDAIPIASELDVSIPALGWSAISSERDATYRFSALTLNAKAPLGANLDVVVRSVVGDYVNLAPFQETLPLAVSSPPTRADFLRLKPLWPTTAFRPPDGETAVRGRITSATSKPVENLAVEIWTSGAPAPPAGTPSTRTNAAGEFLYRLPGLKGISGTAAPYGIRLDGGAVPVTQPAPTLVLGRTQILTFPRN